MQRLGYAAGVDPRAWVWGGAVVKTALVYSATSPTLAAGQAWVPTDTAHDRTTQKTYDNAGRLATETVVGADNSQTQKTTYAYDAADRLLQVSVTDGAGTAGTARTTRFLYDSVGRVGATIDAKGYVTETLYDLAGRVVKTVRYATVLANPNVTDLAALKATLSTIATTSDLTTRYLYDGQGREVGTVDAEGYFTESIYDEASNQRAVKAYAKKLTGLAGTESLSALRTLATTGAPSEAYRLTQRAFNALGQLQTELNPEGTVTRYSYDEAGRLVRTESGYGTTEVRENNLRYDVFGNVIGEISGENVAKAIQALAPGKTLDDPTLSSATLDAVYAQYGVRHDYDLLGRRIESIDAQGNKTWTFYDNAGRATFVVRGVKDGAGLQNAAGEVTETRYGAFGEVTDVIAYTGRITIGTPGSRASVQTAIATLTAIGSTDSRLQLRYDQRGLLTERVDAEGYRTTYGYNAFGEEAQVQEWTLANALLRTQSRSYDVRGQLTGTTDNAGALTRSQGWTYDAFGRMATATDARGTVTQYAYDRRGRQVQVTQVLGASRSETVSSTYDAFDRVLTTTDARGATTSWVYSDIDRSIVMTTPEGFAVTTKFNRFGQTIEVRQPLPGGGTAVSSTAYDRDGHVITQTDALGKILTNEYDIRGLLAATVDATGRRVEYAYDAVGRMLTRTEDPGTGRLNLVTTTVYDAQGRQIRVTDASGRVTTMTYDRNGQLTEVVRDPSGLALKTTYTWDRDGRQLSVTEGANTANATTTTYAYDGYGRRTGETVAPGTLALTTTYVYDANDNVVSKTDASGRVTRYAYDTADRLRFVLDGTGDVAETAYDLNGRVTMTRRYAKALNTATLGATPSETDIATAIQSQSLANDALDEAEYRVYDANGRERFRIDGAGDVVEQVYDAGGRVTRQTRYANRIALAPSLRTTLTAGATPASITVTAAASDENVRYVYDAAGQLRYTIEGTGSYSAVWYDAAGRIAVKRAMIKPLNPGSIADGMTVAQIDAMNQWGATDDLDMFVYDGAGRLRYALQTVGDPTATTFTAAVTETRYDGADRVLLTRAFADLMTLDATLIGKLGGGTATDADFATFTAANAANAQSERRVYDTAGRQVFVIDGTGGVVATWYDQASRVSVTRALVAKLSTAGLSDATTSAQVSAQLVWGATDDLRMYVYDAAGRQRFALRGVGDITVFPFTASVAETTYDGAGRVLNTRAFADLMSLDATLIGKLGAGTAVETDFAAFASSHAGSVQSMRRVYDAAGRLTYAIDGTGAYIRTWYDGAGRVSVTRAMVARLSTASLSDATTVDQLNPLVTWGATDDLRMYVYDAAGRQRFVLRGIGDITVFPFTASVAETLYDGAGRVLNTRAFTDLMSLDATLIGKLGAGTAAESDFASFATSHAANVQSERRVYDASGRAVYVIDAAGAYARTWYDGMGRAVAVRRFDAAFAPANVSDATTTGQLDALLDWSAASRTEFRVYDATNQLRIVYDANAMVSRMDYDGAGRLVMTHRYGAAFAFDSALNTRLFAGTATIADFATFTSANEATARAAAQVYDAAGQLRFSLDRDGTQWLVGERQYDGIGRTTVERRCGFAIAYSQGQTESTVVAAIQAQLSTDPQIQATQYRATRYLYDGANQVRYVADATGALSESRYEGAGRVIESRSYANRPTGATFTTAGLDAWVQTQATADIRKLVNAYDAGGRLLSRTDALSHSESFAYDGIGRMTSRTDRAGAVWTYQYDGAGRRVAETSPQVQVNTVDGAGAMTTTTRAVVTRYAYDALGQLVTKTENADTGDTRVTQYTYDTRGHLTRTTLPNPGAVDPTTGAIVYAGNPPTVDTTYDFLGRAVVVKDAAGQYSYRVYDGLDRVIAEVDPLLNVSTYAYNAYGEQTSNMRFAATLNTAASAFTSAGWTTGKAMTAAEIAAGTNAGDAANRTITTEYDGLGRKTKVLLPALSYYKANGTSTTGQPTTTFAYNAYGESVRESVLLEGTAGQSDAVWADTWRFYDAAGRNTLTVDAEGYVTRTDYNATGEATKVVEYARAVSTASVNATTPPSLPTAGDATTGYDREIRWTYDVLGRKASETVVRTLRTTSGGAQTVDATTTYGYDNEDRATTVTDASGTVTTTYDALGHVVAVQEQARSVLVSNAGTLLQQSNANTLASAGLYVQRSPYTTMAYDAFGNVVGVRRYANGRDGTNAAVADDTRDQITVTRYLKSGQAAMSRDPLGNFTYSAYDAAGRLLHAWSRLEGSEDVRDAMVHRWYTYDAAGRQTGSRTLRTSLDGATVLGADQSEAVTYNAFGEIATKTYGEAGALLAGTLQYGYDAAGRMISDNAVGATRQFGYNLAGFQVRESHMTWIDTATGALDTVTWTKTDRLGRAVSVQLPSYTTSASDTALVRQAFDRWGNVVQVVDARGYQTDYQFDDRNQVVQETRPLVWVVNESGAGSWQRPVNAWYYDALGRLSGTRDANGNLTSYAYDAGGRMLAQTDALGNVTRHAYDALGNEALAQDALGYITSKSYDQAGRVTAIGDYLASGTGRQSAVLQAYVLNQNGDRLRVTNALGQTQRYDYDSQQRLLRSETAMGVVAGYAYDVQGHKIRETNGLTGQTSMAAPSGTWTDRDGDVVQTNSLRWVYDAFGRVTDHNDLGGRDSNYVYDAASGMLKQETTAGGAYGYTAGDKTISYTRNGRVRKIEEVGGGTYLYEYDAAGNRVKEDVTAVDGDNKTFHLLTRTTYDSNNRVQRVVQDDVPTGKRIFDLIYDYDANGNRRRVVSQSGFGDNVSGITVTDSAPVVTAPPQDRGAKKGQTSTFRLLFSDVFRDAEGDALTLAISKGDGSALPSWLTATRDAQTGEIVFVATPAAGAADEDVVVKLTAYETSNSAKTVSTTFTVKVRSNNAPETLGPGAMTYYPKTGQAYGRDLLAGDFFRDIDVNDALALSVIGTLPPGMTATATGGLVHVAGTPTTAGTYSITLRATDQAGATADKTITFVCAANAAPTATAQAATDATLNSTYLWQKTLSEVFTDPNGDTLQVSASGLPNWLSFQYQTSASPPKLMLNGVVPPTEQDNTTYNVVLTATDPSGASVSTTVQVRVTTNIAPEAPPVSNRNARQGAAFTEVLPAFFDANGDTLTIGLTGLPPGLSFNTATRTISGTPTTGGSWTVTYSANDGRVTTSTSFTLAVEANAAPVAPTIAAKSGVRTTPVYLVLPAFTDANNDTLAYSVSGLPTGMSFNAATRTIAGRPTATGSWTVTYTANDGRGGVASTTFGYTIAEPVGNQVPW
ncbi:MAG: putative Ig domain-containing protein [Lysobacteraceae bacterium]